MMRFFSEDIGEGTITFDQEESRHLVKVLRLKEGQNVEVFDGKGNLYHCSITTADPKKAILHITSKCHKKEQFFVTLAVAPPKNLSRWEWLMEKATEIGVDKIIPFTCENSERKILKLERQKKILISAAKQSLKQTVPILLPLISFQELMGMNFAGDKFIAHCNDGEDSKDYLKKLCKPATNSLILIGPEGDFTEKEIKTALEKGFKAISLGKSRLRTETAALAACHIINLENE